MKTRVITKRTLPPAILHRTFGENTAQIADAPQAMQTVSDFNAQAAIVTAQAPQAAQPLAQAVMNGPQS